VLDSPQAFGLGHSIPQPLADSLQAMRMRLGQALQKEDYETTPDDLEAELSQDADSLCHAN
jgi:hypothetical protein